MANAATYNLEVDKQSIYEFDLEITDDNDVPTDISTWLFHFFLKNSLGDIIWNIPNADIARPTISSIYFTKPVAELELVIDGNYYISLLATNDKWTDNEIMIGTWAFK